MRCDRGKRGRGGGLGLSKVHRQRSCMGLLYQLCWGLRWKSLHDSSPRSRVCRITIQVNTRSDTYQLTERDGGLPALCTVPKAVLCAEAE